MTVEQALNDWPKLMDTGLRLGSPAAGQKGAFSWTKQFMDGVKERNYRVDFLAFHWYAYDNYNINEFKTFLQNISQTYPGYKIWITEFSNHSGTPDINVNFFNEAERLSNSSFA